MTLLENEYNWLIASFLIFCFICYKFGKAAFLGLLDTRIDGIKKELEVSESLRIEAQELLAQYQRKQRDAEKEAEEIIARAEKNAIQIRKNAENQLSETLKRREQQLKDRLVQMEETAIQEIREHAANLAVEATRQIITENLDKKESEKLLSQSVADVSKSLH